MSDIVRDRDNDFIAETLRDGDRAASEPALLKIQTGENAGNPAHGVARTFIYTIRKTKMIVSSVAPQDIMTSGGIYQVGDIQAQLFEELKADDTNTNGDRIIWHGNEYRVVGKVQPGAIADAYHLFSYALRKIGKV